MPDSAYILAVESAFSGFLSMSWRIMESIFEVRKHVNFFWPIFGWMFPPGKSEDWINYFLDMFRNSYIPGFSYVFISELLGAIIIMLFVLGYSFYRKK